MFGCVGRCLDVPVGYRFKNWDPGSPPVLVGLGGRGWGPWPLGCPTRRYLIPSGRRPAAAFLSLLRLDLIQFDIHQPPTNPTGRQAHEPAVPAFIRCR